jgi:hypothetical protein
MPELSDTNREYTINGYKYHVSDKIEFKDNCVISYDQEHLDKLENSVNKVFRIMDKICPHDYWAVGGTLLGAVRHGSLIPFDDDMDIAITTKGYDLIKEKMDSIKRKYGFDILEHACGFKIYENDEIVCDIFVCDYINPKTMVYSGPYFNGKSNYGMHTFIFPFIKFKATDIFPLQRMKFGQITINVPKKTKKILINNYNKHCFTQIIPPKVVNFHNINIFNGINTTRFFSDKISNLYIYPETAKLVCWIPNSVMVNYNMSTFTKSNLSSILQKQFIDNIDINKLVNEIDYDLINELYPFTEFIIQEIFMNMWNR